MIPPAAALLLQHFHTMLAHHSGKMTNVLMQIVLIFMISSVTLVDGFVSSTLRIRTTSTPLYAFGRATRSKSSPLLDEALAAYPFRFQPEKKTGTESGEKLYASVTQKQATTCFNELARLYGDEEALAIVKIQPRTLTFSSEFFEPCLEAWTEQFGLEASQAMVRRNPGLLGVNPILAREPAEASMALSYVVAITRPLPKLIAAGLLLSIATAGLR